MALSFRTLRIPLIAAAAVLLLAYALVGREDDPGIAGNAAELARNAADSTGGSEEPGARSEPAPEAGPNGSDAFAEYGIGEYAVEPEAGTPPMPEGLPSAEGDRPGALVTPEMGEEALVNDIAEAIRAQGGN